MSSALEHCPAPGPQGNAAHRMPVLTTIVPTLLRAAFAVRGIADGVRQGDILGNVAAQFAAPTESLNGLVP